MIPSWIFSFINSYLCVFYSGHSMVDTWTFSNLWHIQGKSTFSFTSIWILLVNDKTYNKLGYRLFLSFQYFWDQTTNLVCSYAVWYKKICTLVHTWVSLEEGHQYIITGWYTRNQERGLEHTMCNRLRQLGLLGLKRIGLWGGKNRTYCYFQLHNRKM